MANLYYAKLSVNSEIFKVYAGEVKISDILDALYKKINDEVEYVKTHTWLQKTENGFEEKQSEEIYCFSDIEKNNDSRRYILGRVIRRFPLFTEEYDENTRSVSKIVHENNAVSINFYFDVDSEIITFCTRRSFGQLQFVDAFKELINECMSSVHFEIFLIKDSLNIKERLKNVYKVTRIKSIVIPPNANEDHLKELYDASIKTMEEANVTKRTSIFEVSHKSEKGINVNSKMVTEELDVNEATKAYKIEKGYGKIEVHGEHRDGSKFFFDSDVDSPYITLMDEENKNITRYFIEASRNGIAIFLAREIGQAE